jgi:hypothetical protein
MRACYKSAYFDVSEGDMYLSATVNDKNDSTTSMKKAGMSPAKYVSKTTNVWFLLSKL